MSEEEIIDYVIKASGTAEKYIYKGMSLRQYCLKNSISYSTILSRIQYYKKRNPESTDDEVVLYAMEDFENCIVSSIRYP